MALTQEQIIEARKKYGIPTEGVGAGGAIGTGSTGNATPSWFADAQAQWQQSAPKPPAPPKLGDGALGDFSENVVRSAISPLVRTGSLIEKGLDQTAGRVINAAKGNGFVPTTSGQEAADTADAIDEGANDTTAGKVGSVVGTVAPYLVGGLEGKAVTEAPGVLPKVANFVAKKAPQLAADIGVGTAQTGDLKEGAVQGAAGLVGSELLGKTVAAIGSAVAPKTAAEKLANAINAVNPNLNGKKAIQGYRDLALGKRDVVGGTLTKRQELTAPKEIQELGQRLSDVVTSKNPLSNLRSLGKALKETETKLDDALVQGDPSFQYLADKPGLFTKLSEGETKIPREYEAIRDSKSVFNNVFNFAKGLVDEGEDTIPGLRDMRSAFDYQARLEYPNAFKEGGSIDVKTPAGRAIKQVRDIINDHLYETAPNGSQIKELIRREADIFRAVDNIAPKAAETHGLTTVDKIVQGFTKHPYVAGLAGLGAIGAAAYALPKAVQAGTGQ